MSELRPRTRSQQRRATQKSTIARHGRLRKPSLILAITRILAICAAVCVVSAACVAGVAAWNVGTGFKTSADLVDVHGNKIPSLGAISGSFNVLLAGSDSGDGNAAYGTRGENLNDVTMLLHVSADHKHATVVSFPRDMLVSIPSCPNPKGGTFSAMSSQKLNNTLTYGGLPCTVLTIEKLTGLTIPYAALIQFDGVIEMSDAVGGVTVCSAGPIVDPYTGLNIKAGNNTLEGAQALAFLRTRHGVGDGSDLGRISNQQVFLSSLVRTIKSADTLSNPVKIYSLAHAASSNMTLSPSLNLTTMASMALALKNVAPSNFVFVQYPNHYVQGGGAVTPTVDSATELMTALANDTPFTLTGTTGVGSVTDPNAPTTSGTPAATPSAAAGSGSATSGSGASGTGSGTGSGSGSVSSGSGSSDSVALPSNVNGQTASEYTCSKPFSE